MNRTTMCVVAIGKSNSRTDRESYTMEYRKGATLAGRAGAEAWRRKPQTATPLRPGGRNLWSGAREPHGRGAGLH